MKAEIFASNMPRRCSHGARKRTSPGGTSIAIEADIPKGYEIGEKSLSPNGRFAILYPIRGDDTAELPPNLLVCLKPYSVLTRIGTEGGRWQGARDQPLAKWNGNSIVAIWIAARWGMKDLAIYEIEADEIKRIQPVWRRVWLLFDRRFSKALPEQISGRKRVRRYFRLQRRRIRFKARVGIQGP